MIVMFSEMVPLLSILVIRKVMELSTSVVAIILLFLLLIVTLVLPTSVSTVMVVVKVTASLRIGLVISYLGILINKHYHLRNQID